jgi:hypothetical protein
MGLRIGLLVGIGFALFKTLQARRDAKAGPSPEPWQPIVDTPRPRSSAAPAGAGATAARPVDEVGEPVQEPPQPERPRVTPSPALKMPDVPTAARVEADVAMAAEEIVEPEPAALPEPLDVVAEKPELPVKKAAKAAKKAVKKAAKKAVKKAVKKAAKGAKSSAEPAPAPAASGASYVMPVGGVCPTSHQVKAKLASKRFHLPGMFAYDRTTPDRCYLDAGSAEADGFTKARR